MLQNQYPSKQAIDKIEISAFELEVLKTELETRESAFKNLNDELYNNIGQIMSSSKILIGITERFLHQQAPHSLLCAGNELGKAIEELRLVSRPLHENWMKNFGFLENIDAEINKINSLNKFVFVKFTYFRVAINLSPAAQIILFCIVLEGLKNSINQNNSTKVELTIQQVEEKLVLVIKDNGIVSSTIDPKKLNEKNNMKYRTTLLGGTIEWFYSSRSGTRVYINIPNN